MNPIEVGKMIALRQSVNGTPPHQVSPAWSSTLSALALGREKFPSVREISASEHVFIFVAFIAGKSLSILADFAEEVGERLTHLSSKNKKIRDRVDSRVQLAWRLRVIGSWWRPIRSVIILVINKSDSRRAVARNCYYSYDYKQLLAEVFVISRIIKVEVGVFGRSRSLTETLIIMYITKLNLIIVLLYIEGKKLVMIVSVTDNLFLNM